MPNTGTVGALINAFNVHNYARNTVKTNFTLQSRYGENCIVVSFGKGMGRYQCSRYLDSIKRKTVGEFYGIEEEDTDEVVLNTANLIFNIESFPFNTSKGKWSQDEQGRIEFLAPIDKGVIFNLKSHLASSLKKDILEGMPACRIVTKASDKKDYLWHGNFDNKESCKQFKRGFLSRMKARYEDVPKNPLKVEGNGVYIKEVFDNARFIDSVTRYKAWLVGMYLGVESSANCKVRLFKDMIIESISQAIGVTVAGFIRNFPLNEKTAKILIPVVLDNGEPRMLASEEAFKLSYAFNYAVFNDLYSKVQAELPICGDSGVYGIDFSNKEISHCVITKIIESSVINRGHELAIDPELVRALSPAQSPFNSPTHAGPSGLRTPPNQRKKDTDSGYDSSSPPKPRNSGSSSGGPSSSLTGASTQGFPTQSHGKELEGSPRQGSGKEQVLHNPVDLAGTSKGFSPRSHLSSIAVSYGVSGPSSSLQSVGAAQNVRAGTSAWTQQPNR